VPRSVRRSVVAKRERWIGHVKVRHPEISDHLDAVRQGIEAPERIFADAGNPDGVNYYRFGVLPSPYHRLYLKVCVTFDVDADGLMGTLVTAYPTKRFGRGEVQLWP
jgi:hypothetical protein